MKIYSINSNNNTTFETRIPHATKECKKNVVNDFWPKFAEMCSNSQKDTNEFKKLMDKLKSDKSKNILALDYREKPMAFVEREKSTDCRYIFRLYDSFEKLILDRTEGNVFESNSINGKQITVVNNSDFPDLFHQQFDYFANKKCKSDNLAGALLETLDEILTPNTEANKQIFSEHKPEKIDLDLYR